MTWRDWLIRQIPDPEETAAWVAHTVSTVLMGLGCLFVLVAVTQIALGWDAERRDSLLNFMLGVFVARIVWWRRA